MKCHKCDWEGPEEKLVETPGNLMFYDHVAINTMGLNVTRSNHLCPNCGEMLRSRRLVDGVPFDR